MALSPEMQALKDQYGPIFDQITTGLAALKVKSTLNWTVEYRAAMTAFRDLFTKFSTDCDTLASTPVTPKPLSSLPLINQPTLVYQGAFRVPIDWFSYADGSIAFDPSNGTLFLAAADFGAEISIPVPVMTGSVSGLPTAAVIQSGYFTENKLYTDINPDDINPKSLGGLLVNGGKLIISGFSTYDGSNTQTLSHFRSGKDLTIQGDVEGPFALNIQQPIGTTRTLGAGFVSGYMCPVPSEWQAALGGTALTGNALLSIITRTSYGPCACVFDPALIGSSAPTTPLVCYPDDHPSLGAYGTVTSTMGGVGIAEAQAVAFPDKTRSILFFGRIGSALTWEYGEGTNNPLLNGTIVPNLPLDASGLPVRYWYDPEQVGWKGGHGYPYTYQIWAYDALDLVAVKNKTKKPWEVLPYATWKMTFPFSAWFTHIHGAAYDPSTNKLFIVQGFGDMGSPIIHVYRLSI